MWNHINMWEVFGSLFFVVAYTTFLLWFVKVSFFTKDEDYENRITKN